MAHNSGADCGHKNKYSHRTKTGNWNEEKELYDRLVTKYSSPSADLVQTMTGKATAMRPVTLSSVKDGFVHFGDTIMLYSVQTEGVLSVDLSDRVPLREEGYACTTSTLTQEHVARNVFIIEPYNGGGRNVGQMGDVLKLGQACRLRVHPAMSPAPLYLFSLPAVTGGVTAKIQKSHQLVAFADVAGYDTAWTVEYKLADERFEYQGQPVPANAQVVIRHGPTGRTLSSDKVAYDNDFGREFEVCGHIAKPLGHQSAVVTSDGIVPADTPVRQESPPNFWAMLTAATPEAEGAF